VFSPFLFWVHAFRKRFLWLSPFWLTTQGTLLLGRNLHGIDLVIAAAKANQTYFLLTYLDWTFVLTFKS